MGVEEGGPSEEDKKICPTEPTGRIEDIDLAHGIGNVTKFAEEELTSSRKKLKELRNEEDKIALGDSFGPTESKVAPNSH